MSEKHEIKLHPSFLEDLQKNIPEKDRKKVMDFILKEFENFDPKNPPGEPISEEEAIKLGIIDKKS